MSAPKDIPPPKQLAAQLGPLLSHRRTMWLPEVYYRTGMLLKRLLDDTGRERFDYGGHLQDAGKILRKEHGAGTPMLHLALCMVKTIDQETLEDFRAAKVSWTAIRFVLRALSSKCDYRPARLAKIRRKLKNYVPARFTAYVRSLLPGEKAGKPPKKGEPAFVVVNAQGWLHSRHLLTESDAERIKSKHQGSQSMTVVAT